MAKRILLLTLVGLPISSLALWYIFGLLAGAAEYTLICVPFAIAGLWSVFTGNRTLWRFDTAHLRMRWHDWIGFLFASLYCCFLVVLCVSDFTSHYPHDLFSKGRLIGYAICLSALSALTCLLIVIRRFLHQLGRPPEE